MADLTDEDMDALNDDPAFPYTAVVASQTGISRRVYLIAHAPELPDLWGRTALTDDVKNDQAAWERATAERHARWAMAWADAVLALERR